jgi:hypothetical protein
MRRHHPVPVNLFTLFRPAGRRRTRRAVVPQRDEGGSSLTYYFEAPGNPGDLGCLVSLCPLWLDDSFCPFCHSVQNPLPVQPGQAQSSPVKPYPTARHPGPQTLNPKPQPRVKVSQACGHQEAGFRQMVSASVLAVAEQCQPLWPGTPRHCPRRSDDSKVGPASSRSPAGTPERAIPFRGNGTPSNRIPLFGGGVNLVAPPRNQPNRMETRLKSPRIQVNPADTSISFPPRFWPSRNDVRPCGWPRCIGPSPGGFHRKPRRTVFNAFNAY